MCNSVTEINVYLKRAQQGDHIHKNGYMDMLISLILLIIL